MESIREISLQEAIEEQFNRKHIDRKIRDAIEGNPETMEKIVQGVELISTWLQGEYYASKQTRLNQLKALDLQELVMDLIVGVAYSLTPELFTSVSAKLAARLKFNDKVAAIATVAELLAVLCHTDLFDITKEERQSSLMLVSRVPLPDKLIDFIRDSQYLPPMVCAPLKLTHNYSSGYLTHNDSLMLGSGNHHDGDLCLDVLNIMNAVPLRLDPEFLDTLEEIPTFEIETQDQQDMWMAFKTQSQRMYALMIQSGNHFYLTHKVDKRGRIYSQGYHINTQGASYKKASLELADEELIEGVPT
jgi:hypothetical protein